MTIAGTASPVGGAVGSGTAPVTFTPADPGAQVASNVQVLWDFDNDSDWDQAEEDITSYVMSAETGIGRDSPSNLTGRSGPGKLRLSLNNTDDRFSFFNTSSPLNADPFSLKTGRRVRVQTTDGVRGASLITYIGIGAVAVASNASVVPALPTGLATGDLMVCVASIRNSGTGTVNTPTGWANLVTTGNLTLLGRYYQTGDTAPTVTFTGGVANATTMAQVAAFRGCHQTLGHVVATSAVQLNGSAQNIATPARTIAENNCAVLAIGWKQDDWTSVAALSGFTEISDSPTVTGDDAGQVIDYQIQTTATNIGATSFTVTGGANAISRAMVVALRPAVDQVDPVLLIRDQFNRPDTTTLGVTDTGQAWSVRANGGFAVLNGTASANDDRVAFSPGIDVIETVDSGTTDHYVQASLPHIVQDGRVGLIVRYDDTNNYTRAYYLADDRGIVIEDVSGGVATDLNGETWIVEGWESMTLGLAAVGNNIRLYLGGNRLGDWDINRPLTGTQVGIYGWWETWSDLPPAFDDFYVWDRVATDLDGVLWTGYVKTVTPTVTAGALKVVTVDCEGPLAAAALTDVPAPRITRDVGEHTSPGDVNRSVPAGSLVGDIMARAMLLHPPHPINGELISDIGPVAIDDGSALTLARAVELSARGFLKETQQGQVAFEDRTYRSGDSPVAWFTDTPGVGQYGYSVIEPLDEQALIINQATAQVAATCPTVAHEEFQFAEDGSALTVAITMPIVNAGQLVLVFLVCSADATNVEFGCAPPWKAERNLRQAEGNGIRIFSRIADGSEAGTTAYFYKGTSPGCFTAHIYVIDHWYGTEDGIHVGRASLGEDPYPISPGWSRAPALYIVHEGMIGATSGSVAAGFDLPPPVGYPFTNLGSSFKVSATPARTTALAAIHKVDVTDTENPRAWQHLFANYLLIESVVAAVRGYNGPLGKPTVDNPKAAGGQGLFVTVNDVDSQLDHNVVRTNPDIPVLLYDTGDAQDWGDEVVAEFAEDRPILTLGFWAVKNTQLRELAMRRRLSDRITVTATGNAGLGIDTDFRIEHISHRFGEGMTMWRTSWELSPVAD